MLNSYSRYYLRVGRRYSKQDTRLYVIPYLSSRLSILFGTSSSVFSISRWSFCQIGHSTCERKFSNGMRDGRQSVAE